MEHTVRIHKNDSILEIKAENGIRLLDFLQKNSVKGSITMRWKRNLRKVQDQSRRDKITAF